MNIRATATFRPRTDLGTFVSIVVTPAVRMGVQEITDGMVQDAQARCPVDTGALRDSIRGSIENVGETTIRGTVTTDSDHAAYVEFGTGIRGSESAGAGDGPYNPDWPGMVAQPYMRPAFDEMKGKAREIMSDNLITALSTI